MAKLTAPDGERYYMQVHSRPAPLPRAGLELAALEVGHLCMPSGLVYPTTRTTYCILNWCLAGEVVYEGDGWSLSMEPGQSVVIDADIVITTRAQAEGCEFCYLILDGPGCGSLLDECGLWTGVFPSREAPIEWLESIAGGIDDAAKAPFIAATGLFLFQNAGMEAEELAADPLVWRACRYFRREYASPETNVESLLGHLGVSRSMMSARFRSAMGCTLHEYLADVRYENALRRLRDHELPIGQVGRCCGFRSPSHFADWFRRRNGLSPRDARRHRSARGAV